MRTIAVFLFVLGLSLSLSCKKDNTISMHFNETGCGNPWSQDSEIHVSNNDPDYQDKITQYLALHGILVKSISITNDGPISGCFSCFCSTGRRINIIISEKERPLATELGFTDN